MSDREGGLKLAHNKIVELHPELWAAASRCTYLDSYLCLYLCPYLYSSYQVQVREYGSTELLLPVHLPDAVHLPHVSAL